MTDLQLDWDVADDAPPIPAQGSARHGAQALVIPARIDQACYVITWTGDQLLPTLYREIDCDTVRMLHHPDDDGHGDFAAWLDENGQHADEPLTNFRYMALARALGHLPALARALGPYGVVAGTVVLTGGTDAQDAAQGLPPQLLAELVDAMTGVTASGGS